MNNFIEIISNDGFLHLEDLPDNCIFNKVVTGCGGTTIALSNSINYVIAVPTTELIINKTNRLDAGVSTVESHEVFGLFGTFDNSVKSLLKKYLSVDGVKKILCTYDKLPVLLDYLDAGDYKLLVDEYQNLLKAYSYRKNAVDGVLDNFSKFKSYCFMSATPILPDFKPDALKDVPQVTANWVNGTDKVKVCLKQTNKPYEYVAKIINSYKQDGSIIVDGKESKEAFFFINSVTDIAAILNRCNLSPEEVKIVCADTDENLKKLGGTYKISNSRSENKPFTFITCKSFEGADYFSESGMVFVVSSSTKSHTLLGIDSDLPQIAGRIRTKDNPFRNKIVHIYSNTKLNLDVTYEEMKDSLFQELQETHNMVNHINGATEEVKQSFAMSLNNSYVRFVDNMFVVDDTLAKFKLYQYQLNQVIYKNGIALRKAYESNDIIVCQSDYEYLNESFLEQIVKSKKTSFEEAFIRYAELKKNPFLFAPGEIEKLEKEQPLIVPAYYKLGEAKVRSLKYIKKDVEAALLKLNDSVNDNSKIAKLLSDWVSIGFHSRAELKKTLQSVYDSLGIMETAKASQIEKYINCKP